MFRPFLNKKWRSEYTKTTGICTGIKRAGTDGESFLSCTCRGRMPDLKIMRTEKGKPYVQSAEEQDETQAELKSPNIYISASHSKNLFACLIGDRPLGIDLQHGRKMDPAKISARYLQKKRPNWCESWAQRHSFACGPARRRIPNTQETDLRM